MTTGPCACVLTQTLVRDAVVRRSVPPPMSVRLTSQGYKHSAIPILCAALAAEGLPFDLDNVPDVEDIRVLQRLVNLLGGEAHFDGRRFTILSADFRTSRIPDGAAGEVHGSMYLWVPLLARTGALDAPVPGGCALGGDAYSGGRPVHNVLDVMALFGAEAQIEDGRVRAVLPRQAGVAAAAVDLRRWSASARRPNGPEVTSAAKFALLLAAALRVPAQIGGLPRRESVLDLLEFLCAGLLEADGRRTDVCHVWPSAGRAPQAWRVRSDPTEVMTFLALAAQLGVRRITFDNVADGLLAHRMGAEAEALRRMGVELGQDGAELVTTLPPATRGVRVAATTSGLNTDSQPFFAAMFAAGASAGRISDTVWGGRYAYAEGMRLMGLRVERTALGLTVRPGCDDASPAPVHALDTRQAALMCCLAAGRPGWEDTPIVGARPHLARGYGGIEAKFAQFGLELCWR